MYSELVDDKSVEIFRLTQQYINRVLDDADYHNELLYLLEDFERKVKEDNKC